MSVTLEAATYKANMAGSVIGIRQSADSNSRERVAPHPGSPDLKRGAKVGRKYGTSCEIKPSAVANSRPQTGQPRT